ncbi:hypothetical protein KKG36_00560, partial [Patescibacteria group bacterium]|nr:hypothetical protein [Patescibacteria group bacterium]
MKTLMLMLMVPSFLLGAEPTGGTLIVPPNKRDVQYYDFRAREEVSLTKDVKGPSGLIMTAAISANGEVLAWVQGGKIWWRELPFGPAKLAPNKNSRRDGGAMGVIPIIVPGILKNFCLSAGGQALTYEVRASNTVYNPSAWTKMGSSELLIFHPLSAYALEVMGPDVWGEMDTGTW